MGKRNACKIVFGNPKVRDHLEDVDVDDRLILTYISAVILKSRKCLISEVPVFDSQQCQKCFS